MLAAIALGSNLGNRDAAMAFAAERLGALLDDFRLSTIVETWPVGEGTENQNLYLNAVAVGRTPLAPRALLEALLEIEAAFGRERPARNAPRTLDLDLILHGETVIAEPGLEVPHPRFRERFFVLGPLVEIAPDIIDPVTGRRAADLLKGLMGEK